MSNTRNTKVLKIATSLAVLGIAMAGMAYAAPTPAEKCLSKKMKEAGKYESCRLKAEAKGVIKNEAPDFAKCNQKLTLKWGKLDGGGDCAITGDQTDFQPLADAHTDAVVDLLTNGPPPVCGDGTAVSPEECDGADLAGEDCLSLGFSGGTLSCDGSCLFDTSACTVPACGNGVLDLGEQCDSSDVNGLDCFNLGYSFNVGALACDGSCDFDTSTCMELCGNGVRDVASFESCDGTDLGGSDCTTFGGTGTLACDSSCGFDYSGCSFTCGDGNVDPTEDCDGANLNFETCSGLEYTGGTLACDGSCNFDTSGCTATCGDGIQNEVTGEECDGAGPYDCGNLGYHSGTLTCDGGCLLDDSLCVSECDVLTHNCPVGEACYFTVSGAPGGCLVAGTGTDYQACSAQNDCALGYFCSGSGGTSDVCRKICDKTNGNADCGAGEICFQDVTLPAQPNASVCVVAF